MKLVIIDYGMGNIKSIVSAFKYLGVKDILVSNKYEDIKSADKLLLPGVGSFAKAMINIKELNIDKYLKEVLIEDKKPILGICLGMQLLGDFSEEDGLTKGLSYINAQCEKFQYNKLKVPHVGFNQVTINKNSKLFLEIEDKSDFYFTHSYKMKSEDEISPSFCEYGTEFIVAYEKENILGVQFHPELSQNNGLLLLKNFLEKF